MPSLRHELIAWALPRAWRTRDLDTHVLTDFVDNDIATLLRLDTTREVPECAVPIETPTEADYSRHGGILQYVLRQLAQ